MAYIKWREADGLHSSFACGRDAELILEMITEDDTMTLIEVK
jgi:hypothetical protein